MLRAAAAILVLGSGAWAQAVISAHSGMVNFVEGDVLLAGKSVKLDGAIFPEVKIGQTLSTGTGRAEILLTPGVFLRLDNHTSFRLLANKLTDTQVEILNGSALVEADEILKDNRIVIKMCDAETLLVKNGLYHFNADAGQIRSFAGKAEVSAASASAELKGGRTLLVGSTLTPDKFDRAKSKDDLYAWSMERNYRLELANISAARGTPRRSLSNSLWAWDPWLNTYTFLPRSGRIFSPFGGLSWYSPDSVWSLLQPAPSFNYGGVTSAGSSWQGVSQSSASVAPSSNASTGSVGVSSGSTSSAVASSAGASRGR